MRDGGSATRTTAGLAALACLTAPLAAQSRLRPLVEASAVALHLRSEVGPTTTTLSGTVVGGEGNLQLGPIGLTLGYVQGTLSPAGGGGVGGVSQDVVEGKLLIALRPASWLSLQGGPQARAYVSAGGTQRWLLWRVQARAEPELVPSRVRSFVALFQIVSADINLVEPFDVGRGGEVGVLARLGHSPLWARLGYGIEQVRLGGGARVETVERVTVSVALGRP